MLTGNLKTTRCSEGGLHDTSNSKNDCPWDSRIQKMAKNESLTIYIPHGCVRGGA